MRFRIGLELSVAFLAGSAILVLPVLLDPWHSPLSHSHALVPFVRESIERLSIYSLPLLIVLGVLLGVFATAHTLLLALSATALFPLYSLADLAIRGTEGQDALPWDWGSFAFIATFPLVGISAARFARRKLVSRT